MFFNAKTCTSKRMSSKLFPLSCTCVTWCFPRVWRRVSTCHVTTARVPNVATVAVITCGDIWLSSINYNYVNADKLQLWNINVLHSAASWSSILLYGTFKYREAAILHFSLPAAPRYYHFLHWPPQPAHILEHVHFNKNILFSSKLFYCAYLRTCLNTLFLVKEWVEQYKSTQAPLMVKLCQQPGLVIAGVWRFNKF